MRFGFVKKPVFWIAIVLIGGILFFVNASQNAPKTALTTEQVRVGTLVQTVDASGAVESVQSTALAFETAGVIDAVLVEVGDQVKAGQVLATLRAADQAADTEEFSSAVRVATATVTVAEVSVANARTDVKNANTALTRTLAASAQDRGEVNQDTINALKSALITVRKSVSDADEVLGVDNPFSNQDYRNVLSALDGGALVDAKNTYAAAKEALRAAEPMVFALTSSTEKAGVLAAADQTETALARTSTLMLYVNRVLDATAIDTNDFSAAELSALKGTFNTSRKAVQASQDAVSSTRQALTSIEITTAQSEDTARASVDQAQASLASAEATLAVRTRELERARAQRASAEIRLEKTVLRAVTSGTVTDVLPEPGETVAAGAAQVTVQTVDRAFEVAVNIAEADIAKVSVRDAADITFDAFGDNIHFPGEVMSINPAQKEVEGVVFYEAKVILGAFDEKTYTLKPGMTADVTMTTEQAENVLFVPQRAVLRKEGGSVVRVKTGAETFEERLVGVGLRADEGRIQIVEGLREGEEVVLSVKEL